jgi:hypothetical protein
MAEEPPSPADTPPRDNVINIGKKMLSLQEKT